MQKYIPLEKQSKKAQKEFKARERRSWNGINPATRKIENKKGYNRKKAPVRYDDEPFFVGFSKKNL